MQHHRRGYNIGSYAITQGDHESYSYSFASLYGCKQNLKNLHIFEAFVIKFLGGRSITETTGI